MQRKGRFFVYILECSDKTYYTGYTPDIKRRLDLHNSGKGAKYTRTRRPVKLVWCKEYRYFKRAFLEEKRIKKLTRKQKERLVNNIIGRERRILIMEETKLKKLVNKVMQCQENCYALTSSNNSGTDIYETIINQALLIVNETKTNSEPYGFITQNEAFKKLHPLPPEINGKQLAYKLGTGLGLLKLHREVGKNWILTKLGYKRVQNILQSQKYAPLIDKDRKFLLQGCNQSILFVSEAPSPDAWEKHVLADKNNNFLIKSLLPHLKISLEEFEKYFFWVHYSNCFPGVTSNRKPKKPKDSKCYDTHTVNFINDIKWKGIILMGEYAYKALNRSEPFLEFLKEFKAVPSKLLLAVNTSIMVIPHCSGRNTKARSELGDKFNLLWDKTSEFSRYIIKSLTKIPFKPAKRNFL